ncbi:MAG: hypothetical protein ACRC33_05435, partial [Gemmataceae bacterium]
MATRRTPAGWAEHIAGMIAPLLVVGLAVTLAWFLAELLYVGPYRNRLRWTLFFFVLGVVFVARIAVTLDGPTAALYGLALGAVVFLAFLTFVQYDPDGVLGPVGWLVNAGLMAALWWAGHILTRDCTVLD